MKYDKSVYLIFTIITLMMGSGCALKKTVPEAAPAVPEIQEAESKQDTVPEGIYKARDEVLGYFVPANADIVSVEGRTLKIRPGDNDHVRKGMRFSVFRQGAPFYHPVTNELIGYTEDLAGRIEITGDGPVDGLYEGTIISGDIRQGDIARVSTSRIKLAFFQDRTADWSVSEAFYGALKDSGRFEFMEAYTPDNSADTLARLARGLGAEAALFFSTYGRDGQSFVDIKLYWAEDGGLAGEVVEAFKSDAVIPAPGDEFVSAVFEASRPWKAYNLPGGLLIAMGDVDGNGVDELAVSDGRNIRIYSVKKDFMELWNIKPEIGGSHLSLDILDVNNNGRAEIFVTSAVNPGSLSASDDVSSKNDMSLNSFVLEYDPSEGFRKINENMPYFMRAVGSTLLMQRFSSSRIFGGPVYKARWNGGRYEPSVPFVLPPVANIYGFAFVDWNNSGRADVMTYDKDGRLCLYDDRREMKWRSENSYGPFTFTFESSTRSVANPVVKWSVRGRLAVVKTGRGQEIIAVNREPVLSVMPSLGANKAEVYSLRWDGSTMETKLIMNEIYGSVTDYWIQGKELFLVARAGLGTFLNRLAQGEFTVSSILFYYNFGQAETEISGGRE
ncbi:MAG: hypothetical protein AB1499_01195 [Nitrospirota bacterium]